MRGEDDEGKVNVPADLKPVVVLIDAIGVHLVRDLGVLQLRYVMDCLYKKYQAKVLQPIHSYPGNLHRLVNLRVNNEVKLFEHDVPLNGQVGQLAAELELLGGDWRLKLIVWIKVLR